MLDEVIEPSGFDSHAEAREANWSFGLSEFLYPRGEQGAELRDVDLLERFAYLLCAKNGYERPADFGAKAIFPRVDEANPADPRLRLEVCVDGGTGVWSPAFFPPA